MSPKSGGGENWKVGWRNFVYGGMASIIAEGGELEIDEFV